ncbi:helix-turn-helix domain-containing protein [Paenibacillus eucommiae]|uniref:DNA-binding Xre family transcriptional regulator n=1 Tax=Paenibacillus eucommiae TaxID=1355755 RepID=A0ABS4J156_9BACL|nr:helix-turn-helix transcriptional regulator [Paenibacillus eucommiae]MBP1992519.1 DNA-binding Xre family transcriptional regulator [Paenibacillus eucommiae]
MTVTDRLVELMKERGINRSELSKGAGIPYTTIVALFEKGADNIKLSTMRKLASFFNVKLDDLVDGEIVQEHRDNELSDEDIITMAAHRIGHQGDLSEQEMEKIKLAMRIALAKK